jgi:acetyl-CoA synthetase
VEEDGSETKLSYREIAARSNQVANFLRGLGVKRGDRILIMLPNQVALWEVMLAGIKLGAVIIPATMLLTPEDLADRVDRADIRHVVAAASQTDKFNALPAKLTRVSVGGDVAGWKRFEDAYSADSNFQPDGVTGATDPLLLYFTSGTTSKPKLVLHSHQSYPVGHLSTMYWIGLKPGDIHWNISSPGWAKHAWSCFFAPWNAGATVFVYNYSRFDAKAVLNVISRCDITTLCAPPTVWRMLIQEDLKAYPVKIRELVGAGEPLNAEVVDQIREGWGITIRDGFGQTETTCQIGNTPGQKMKPGLMGRPLPGYKTVLLDRDDNPADEGEICLPLDPGPIALMIGYANDPEKTRRVMYAGHYHTSDLAMRDADGYYTYIGRDDDVFKASDYRISPFELESVLIEHEAVAETAIVPSPDPLRLAVPKCFVTVRSGYEPSRELAFSILKYARENLAPYKRVRRLEFYELPKTLSGKIRRVDLRKMEETRGATTQRPLEFWEENFPELK